MVKNMKTIITGLVAAVMALSVFATSAFATMPMQSSASVASYLDASGFTTYSTASLLGTNLQNPIASTVETWKNFGTITSVQNVEANSGFWIFPAKMQTSEYTAVAGMSSVAQATTWKMSDANIYNALKTPVFFHAEEVDNFGTGDYLYNADITGSATFVSSVGINKPTNCQPVMPEMPDFPSCEGTHC